MIVVPDTSPVLHLARIGRLDLIRAVVGSSTSDEIAVLPSRP